MTKRNTNHANFSNLDEAVAYATAFGSVAELVASHGTRTLRLITNKDGAESKRHHKYNTAIRAARAVCDAHGKLWIG